MVSTQRTRRDAGRRPLTPPGSSSAAGGGGATEELWGHFFSGEGESLGGSLATLSTVYGEGTAILQEGGVPVPVRIHRGWDNDLSPKWGWCRRARCAAPGVMLSRKRGGGGPGQNPTQTNKQTPPEILTYTSSCRTTRNAPNPPKIQLRCNSLPLQNADNKRIVCKSVPHPGCIGLN